jgi:hypothetical protein
VAGMEMVFGAGMKTTGNHGQEAKLLLISHFFLENEIDTVLSEMNTAPIFW